MRSTYYPILAFIALSHWTTQLGLFESPSNVHTLTPIIIFLLLLAQGMGPGLEQPLHKRLHLRIPGQLVHCLQPVGGQSDHPDADRKLLQPAVPEGIGEPSGDRQPFTGRSADHGMHPSGPVLPSPDSGVVRHLFNLGKVAA